MLKKIIKKVRTYYRHYLIKNKTISIISNNCWGGFMYQSCNLQYNSPFVGLFLFAPDYIKLLKDIKNYLEEELVFIKPKDSKYIDQIDKTYPIALLKDIEIHFLHYHDCEEARRKWNKRLSRLDFDNLIVKFCDRDLCTPLLIKEFDALPFPNKVCFAATAYPELKSVIHMTICAGEEMVFQEWEYSNKYYDFIRTANKISKKHVNA